MINSDQKGRDSMSYAQLIEKLFDQVLKLTIENLKLKEEIKKLAPAATDASNADS